MAQTSFSKYILVRRSEKESGYFAYKPEDGAVTYEWEMGAFNLKAKIEVEHAKINKDYFHLRYSQSNKYWSAKDGVIVAVSTKPEENIKKEACTLFQAIDTADAGVFQMIHVPSGFYVESIGSTNPRIALSKVAGLDSRLSFVDWETIVKLPNRIALKSNTGEFLRAVKNYYNAMEFKSDDPNAPSAELEIQLLPSGEVRIKSVHFGKCWKRNPDDCVYADSGVEDYDEPNSRFWPIKINENTIALRCQPNQKFCRRNGSYYDYLYADAKTIGTESRFGLQELVSERKIYNVKYELKDARMYDQVPYVAGSDTLKNDTDEVMKLSSKLAYEHETSYTFTSSVSVTAGIKFTFEGNLLAVKSSVELSAEVSVTSEWGHSTSERTTQETAVEATVPKKSSVKINYIGTKGKYNVPFSYTQRDVDSSTGKVTITQHDDGIYIGLSSFAFKFETEKAVPLLSSCI